MCSKVCWSALVVALSFAGVGVYAQGSYSAEYNSCMGRAHGTVQQGMCAQTELSAQDARLNKAYQQVMHQYASDPAKQTALRTEERSWLKKRDYQCKVDGNTIDNGCLMQQTAARADALEGQIKF